MARIRTKSTTKPQGRIQRNGVVNNGGFLLNQATERCEDFVGPGDNHRFLVERHDYTGGVINLLPWHTGLGRAAENWTCDALTNGAIFGHIAVPDALPMDTIVAQAAARTNPSRPYVDVPIMILELGDITKLLANSTRYLARGDKKGYAKFVAANNIRYQFGIAPLVGDLVKLLKFRDAVVRRIRELNKLKTKGLRRTISFGSASASVEMPNQFLQSSYMTVTSNVKKTTTVSQKVHCRWKPTGNILRDMDDDEMSVIATRAVLGLTADASTAWELMPWSWLIDWNIAIGDYFKANRNIVSAELSALTYIEHTLTVATTPHVTHNGSGTCTGINRVLERKLRQPTTLNPQAHFPFLDGRQMGILASLAIMRT